MFAMKWQEKAPIHFKNFLHV